MRVILLFAAILAFFAGGSVLNNSQSVLHEIEAFILLLIGAVFLSGACIIDAVYLIGKKIITKIPDKNSNN